MINLFSCGKIEASGFESKEVHSLIPDCELPRPVRPDGLAEGGASCFYDVGRLRLTAHQTESGERTLQIQVYPQGVQSPQALTNRGAIRLHTRNLRFLGTFLRSVPLLVARRGDSVGQRTLLVAFERYLCPSASHGASRSEWNDERIEADRSEHPAYSFVRRATI